MYPPAIEGAFGWNGADYAILEKQYASAADPRSPERRYSPGGIHTTPGMEAGLADRVYKMSDLVLSLT